MTRQTRRLVGIHGRRLTRRRTRPRTCVRIATDDRRGIGVLGVEGRTPGTAAPKLCMPTPHTSRAIVLAMAEGLTALRAGTRPRGMPVDGIRITRPILMPPQTDALVDIRCHSDNPAGLGLRTLRSRGRSAGICSTETEKNAHQYGKRKHKPPSICLKMFH